MCPLQIIAILVAICSCIMLNACGQRKTEQTKTLKEINREFNLNRFEETEQIKTIEVTQKEFNLDRYEEEITKIKETKHHESLASKHNNICPKLLQQQVDISVIRRSQEHLKGEYCDYYLYPKKGQFLNATSKSSALDIYLRMPYLHDFSTGKYLVQNNNRHVIRVSYAGSQLKPNDLTYNINIEFE